MQGSYPDAEEMVASGEHGLAFVPVSTRSVLEGATVYRRIVMGAGGAISGDVGTCGGLAGEVDERRGDCG